jgi:F0F1-type ATP synthase delta subunit
MEKLYAQALWKSIENGRNPKEAVESLAKLLKKQARLELMPKIAKAFARLAEANKANRTRIFVAHEKNAKAALKASGVVEADVCVDETLIGGWRLEGGNEVVDRSFKKYLLDIYNEALAA